MKRLLSILSVLFLAFPVFLPAQSEAPPLTLATPRNAVHVHLYYLQPDSYQPELAARVIYGVPDSARRNKLAIQLKQIFDGKGLYVRLNQLPDKPDYADTLSGNANFTPFPIDLPQVYLEQIDGKWYYSPETVGQIAQLHEEVYPFGADFIVNLLPKFGNRSVMGLKAWQWLGLFLLLTVAILVHLALSRILNPVARRLTRSKRFPSLIEPRLVRKLARLASMIVLLQVLKLLLPMLMLPIETSTFAMTTLRILTTLAIVLILLRILDVVMLYAGQLTEGTRSKLDDQLIPIIRRTLQVVIFLFAILQVLRLLDVNITALIAGVSIGGLALALAAQDTVKNLIGSAMIFVDRPFQIGDWIEVDNIAGSVAEVGFRTTRIQTLDSSIIAVPNGNIANMSVKNLGVRVYRLFNAKLGVTYDTPPDLLEAFLQGLKELILAHPATRKEGFYVHFSEMADSSLNILFRCAILVDDYAGELQSKEELYFGILRLAETLGVSFAFPSTSVYVETMPAEARKPTRRAKPDFDAKVQTFLEDFRKRVQR